MTAARLKGWERRLIEMVGAELDKPYDWGTSNCGHLMAASVRACLGDEHPSLEALKAFDSEEHTKALVSEAGGVANILRQWFEEVPSMYLVHAGDLVVVGDAEVGGAGCVFIDGRVVGKTEKPNRRGSCAFRMPRSSGTNAFKVG